MAEQGVVKKIRNDRRSLWISRTGKPDIFGAANNSHASTKNPDGTFMLKAGDAVRFEVGTDSMNRPLATDLQLVSPGVNNMAGNNNNNNNNNGGNNHQKQKNQQSRIFVDLPTSGDLLTEVSTGKYTIRVLVGQTPDPQDQIRARVYVINGENRRHVASRVVYMPTDIELKDIELDLKEAVWVEVEKVGFGNSNDGKDRVQLSAKPKQGENKAAKLEKLISKFISFASGGSPNIVQIIKKDGAGKPVATTLTVFLGQNGSVNDVTAVDGMCSGIDVSDTGTIMLRVKLEEKDTVVTIVDSDGESKTEYLRKAK